MTSSTEWFGSFCQATLMPRRPKAQCVKEANAQQERLSLLDQTPTAEDNASLNSTKETT